VENKQRRCSETSQESGTELKTS